MEYDFWQALRVRGQVLQALWPDNYAQILERFIRIARPSILEKPVLDCIHQ